MKIEYILHARRRMEKYLITESDIESALSHPSAILEGNLGRKIYQRRLNGHLLRVVVEEETEIKRVITVYFARSDRYEI